MYLLVLIAIKAPVPSASRHGAILQPAGAEMPASSIEEDPFSMASENSSLNNPKGGGTGTADLKTSGFSQMDEVDPQEYARLLDLYDNSFRNIAEGEVVKGTVLKVTETGVVVDVGFKSEGIIALDEFLDATRQVIVPPADA